MSTDYPPPPSSGSHKSDKAEAAAAKARAKATRPWYQKKRFIIPLALLVLIVLVSITSSGGDESSDTGSEESATTEAPAEQDEQATEEDEVEEEEVPDEVPDNAEFAGIGEEARDGDFAFTVIGLEEIGDTISSGDEWIDDLEASGTFYQLTVDVENIGNSAQRLDASDQYLYDSEERRFSAVDGWDLIGFGLYEDSPTFEQLNPGATIEGGVIIFDVTEGVDIEFAELHDSMFSGGVLVDLR